MLIDAALQQFDGVIVSTTECCLPSRRGKLINRSPPRSLVLSSNNLRETFAVKLLDQTRLRYRDGTGIGELFQVTENLLVKSLSCFVAPRVSRWNGVHRWNVFDARRRQARPTSLAPDTICRIASATARAASILSIHHALPKSL
jgi:hypothetical protein